MAFASQQSQGSPVTTTTAANYIPEIWSDGIKAYLEKKLVFEQLVDTSLSGLVKGRGDVFHIPKLAADADAAKQASTPVNFSANTHGEAQLTIDQHRYVAKMVEDMAATQANPGLLEKEVSGMGYALAKQIDIFIEGLIEAQNTASHVDLATDNQLTAAEIRSALQLLMENDVPTEECNMVIHPRLYVHLLSISDFVDASKYGAGAPAATGEIGKIYGVPVFTSTNIAKGSGTAGDEMGYMFHPSSVSFARQIDVRTQSEYSVDYLGQKVVADVLYGGVKVFDDRIVEFRNS